MRAAVSRSLGHFGIASMLVEPEIVHFRPHMGDKILVASDGLWDCINQQVAGSVLVDSRSENEAVTALINVCKVRGRRKRDNVTIACHFIESGGVPTNDGCCSIQ